MLQDLLADALCRIKNAERVGKRECFVKASKVIKAVLEIMQDHDYIKSFKFIDDKKGGKFKVELKGEIINVNVIKPRFSVGIDEFEKFEKRYLPARGYGFLIVSTPKGIMDHVKAKKLSLGGKLLAFVF